MSLTDTSLMLWGLLFNSIGLGYFVYGKKQSHKGALLSGIALMILPYFLSSDLVLVAVCLGLMAMPRYVRF